MISTAPNWRGGGGGGGGGGGLRSSVGMQAGPFRHSSAIDSLGPVSRKHQDWFDGNDKEIQELLEEKHQKHKIYLSDTSSVSSKTAYSNICKTVQTRLRETCKTMTEQKG